MSLPNYLAKIKSSGIYRFVWDKSEVAALPAETLRLVVGYSEKGPFNTPVYIRTATEFINTYGNINKKLERRGVYFHRLALQALTTGPILALNLKKFNTDAKNPELVDAVSFSSDKPMFDFNDPAAIKPAIVDLNVEDIYDTNRFWILEPDMLQKSPKMPNYISLSMTDSKDCSGTVFVRGAKVTGYDITVKAWYSNMGEEVPSYFDGYDNLILADFWADVFVFKGKFTPELATSNALSRYFDVKDGIVSLKRYVVNAFGDKVDTLTALAADPNANFLKSYTGCLLPNFKDANNKYVSLDLAFNSDNYLHKMMMDFNIEMLDNGDITVDSLSTAGYDKVNADLMKALIENVGTADYEKVYDLLKTDPETGDVVVDEDGKPVKKYDITPISMFSNVTIVPEISVAAYDGKWVFTDSDFVADPHFYVYKDGKEILSGDKFIDGNKWGTLGFAQGDRFLAKDGGVATITKIEHKTVSNPIQIHATGSEIKDVIANPENIAENTVACVTAPFDKSTSGDLRVDSMFVAKFGTNFTKNETPAFKLAGKVTAPENKYDNISIVYYVPSIDGAPESWQPLNINADGTWEVVIPGAKMAPTDLSTLQVICKAPGLYSTSFNYVYTDKEEAKAAGVKVGDPIIGLTKDVVFDVKGNTDIKFTFDREPEIHPIYTQGEDSLPDTYIAKCNMTIAKDISNMRPIYLEGYVFANPKPISMRMMDKLNWQEKIMSTLTDYKGLRTALTGRKDVDYRYIVDTFEAYVDSEVHSKLAIIAKEKDNALAFLNFPSAKTFGDCDYTSFTDENNRFQVKYIAEGGNKLKNPAKLFSLVSEPNGASYVSYNTPVTFSDGTVKTYVPSAALVSNNFMTKYTSRQPYYIVAGPNYGRIIYNGMIGPDYNYSREDLDILEPMGVNAMVYVPRKGTYINSNQTAKQNPVTALSKINVRELVIFLQDEIEKLLQSYQWEFNTQNLRNLIKAKADVICEGVKANGGIYAYINVCDESNNTPDVIDNEMLILSTEIEPGRGAGKMVQELTIHRTGGLTASVK